MTAATVPAQIRQVAVQMRVVRARQVPGGIGTLAGGGVAQIEAAVDDHEIARFASWAASSSAADQGFASACSRLFQGQDRGHARRIDGSARVRQHSWR
jgi:hypothetical protein